MIMEYEEFLEKYKPIENHIDKYAAFNGCMFETYGEEAEYVRNSCPENIWTIITEGDDMFIIPRYHYVNRLGYFITQIPYIGDDDITINFL